MAFYSLSNAAPEPPAGMRAWSKNERERVDELLAETAEAVAHRKPGSKPSAHNHGWDAVMVAQMCPTRLRLVEK